MKYQKKKNLLDNENIQPSTFRKIELCDIIKDRHGIYDKNILSLIL